MSNVKQYCVKSKCSTLKNAPSPECANYGCITNAFVDEPTRFALLIKSPISTLHVMRFFSYKTKSDAAGVITNFNHIICANRPTTHV